MANQASSQQSQDDTSTDKEGRPPFFEWLVAGIGLALLLAGMGVLGWHALAAPDDGAPAPVIEVRSVQGQDHRYLVKLRIRNTGPKAAADLHISGELWRDGDRLESSELTLDHLPAGSAREAGLFFTQDPRGLRLVLRAEGYQSP